MSRRQKPAVHIRSQSLQKLEISQQRFLGMVEKPKNRQSNPVEWRKKCGWFSIRQLQGIYCQRDGAPYFQNHQLIRCWVKATHSDKKNSSLFSISSRESSCLFLQQNWREKYKRAENDDHDHSWQTYSISFSRFPPVTPVSIRISGTIEKLLAEAFWRLRFLDAHRGTSPPRS